MIEHLICENVRVYQQVKVNFSKPITTLYGPNGCGKTTLLESIYLLATTKSYRTSNIKELIRNGEKKGVVSLKLQNNTDMHLEFAGNRKNFSINGEKKTAAKFCEAFSVVVLAPEHTQITHGGPEKRRKYLDQVIFNSDRNYISTLHAYAQALKNKQALLKTKLPKEVYWDQVGVWNEKLILWGDQIRKKRTHISKELLGEIQSAYVEISKKDERVELQYSKEISLADELKEKSEREYFAQKVLAGPHLDDLNIELRKSNAKQTVSQGEGASILLAMKFAELKHLSAQNITPVFLLDDVGNALDEKRREALFNRLSINRLQTLITTSDPQIRKISEDFGSLTVYKKEVKNHTDLSVFQWE